MNAASFPSMCRQWRRVRNLSQLDLALAANVSQRHVSWLETGRSQPSRDMVIRLSDALEIPLRERNLLLQSAGFSSAYRESQLSAPEMAPILDALNRVLEHHDPLPAIVVDRAWNVVKTNRAADMMLDLAGESVRASAGETGINLALLTLHPDGLRRFITNWEQAAPAFVQRLRKEALAAGDEALMQRFSAYMTLAGDLAEPVPITDSLLPVLPLALDFGGVQLSLFSVISTFGTPQDITTDELRIEAFYPTDASTEQFFSALPMH